MTAVPRGARVLPLRGVGVVLKAATPWNLLALVMLAAGIAAATVLPFSSSSTAGIVAFLPLALMLQGWMALWQAVHHEHVPAVRSPLWIALIMLLACSHASAAALAFLGGGDVWMAVSVHTLCVAVFLGIMCSGQLLLWVVGAAIVYGIPSLADRNTSLDPLIVLIIGTWNLSRAVIALVRREEWRRRMAMSLLLLLHAQLILAPAWVDGLASDSYLAGLWSGKGKFLLAMWTLGSLLLWHSLTPTSKEPVLPHLGWSESLLGFRLNRFRARHRLGSRPDLAHTARSRKVDRDMTGPVDMVPNARRPTVAPERWRVALLRKCLGPPISADLDRGTVLGGGILMFALLNSAQGDSIGSWLGVASAFLLVLMLRLHGVQCAVREVIFGEPGSGLAEIQLLPSWRSAESLRRLLPTIAVRVIARETTYGVILSQTVALLSMFYWNLVFYVEFAVAVLSYGAMQACLALMLLAADPSRMRALHSFGLISTAYSLAAGSVSHLMLSHAGAPWWWLAGLWPLLPMSGVVVLLIRTRRAATP